MQSLLDSISEVPITDIDFQRRIHDQESMIQQSTERHLSGYLESIARFIVAILRIRHNAATREAEADGATEHADPIDDILTQIIGKAQLVLAKLHPSQRREAMATLYAFVVNRCHSTACRMQLERASEHHADSFWAPLSTNERGFCLNMLEECLRVVAQEHMQLTDGISHLKQLVAKPPMKPPPAHLLQLSSKAPMEPPPAHLKQLSAKAPMETPPDHLKQLSAKRSKLIPPASPLESRPFYANPKHRPWRAQRNARPVDPGRPIGAHARWKAHPVKAPALAVRPDPPAVLPAYEYSS
jgi:hypothetical protein